MAPFTRDPLLTAARITLTVFFFLLIFIMAVLGVGIGAVVTVAHGELLAKLAEAGAPASAFWAVLAVMLTVEGMLFLGLRFIRELSGIIRSVGEGDPFRPENADRLSRMGWISVASYGLALVSGAIAAWLQHVAKPVEGLDFNFHLGGGGIVLILVLFILARVFRHGAAMREELEGTV
jgi:hypothetical protein